jgi:asparagine synthase (glutamine-hydrolysing)
MCGITGFYGLEDKELLSKMTSLLEHRGPDQSGYYADETVSLGHRRLSIIDLSEDGRQPMGNEEGTVWVVFNGEIYNYQELREKLEKKGHHFKSKTDTEVIVHAYEEYGQKCVSFFNGDFAFAVYDAEKKVLFLARDRLGIKPLYYTLVDGKFYFASEIKALLAVPGLKREVNPRALNYYLSFYANPLAETMFKGIFKVEPGHSLVFKGKKLVMQKYWDLQMQPTTLQNPEQELLSLLSDSVQKRLRSDVPLGVYLSGGIDSGTVVALMSKFTDKVKTFSVGFDSSLGELQRAKVTAEHFNTDHQEIILNAEAIKALPNIVWHQDEPMGDPTSVPTYLLSKEAKKKVTVVLTGEGADEQFAGYEQEKFMMLHQKYLQKIPFRKSLAFPLQKIPANALNPFFKYMGSLGEEGKKRLVDFISAQNNPEALMSMIAIFNEQEKQELLGKKIENVTKTIKLDKQNLLNSLLLFENKVPLAENLLMKVDKNTMAHGIEARVPFLDHRVVEFAAKLPPELKLKGLQDKYILRKVMKPYLPASKQKKERFFVPVDHWLKDQLQPLSAELLSEKAVKEYFNPMYVQKMLKGYNTSPLFYGRQIWTVLNFQLWHKMFIEEEKVRL